MQDGPQLSLVAFYGEKPSRLADVLNSCRTAVDGSPLGDSFEAYRAAQVHGTICGMESLPDARGLNRNLFAKHGVRSRMDLSGIEGVVRRRLPMSIRIGGFGPGDRVFESLGREPYERSFQIHLASGKVTLIGWPHVDGDFEPRLLEALRRDLENRCNIAHKYDRDNDLYMVLGAVATPISPAVATAVETTVRGHLRDHPVDVRMGSEDLFVVRYEDETLDPGSTVGYALSDPGLSSPEFEALLGR